MIGSWSFLYLVELIVRFVSNGKVNLLQMAR